jgi:tetratricopeptide (TPR) repeat protein
VTARDAELQQPDVALRLAKWACAVNPKPENLNTLGTAHYRVGNYDEAIEILTNVAADPSASDHKGYPLVFLAMANWQLREKDKASEFFREAVQWMAKNDPEDKILYLDRFRAEAEELLGIKAEASKAPSTATKAKE